MIKTTKWSEDGGRFFPDQKGRRKGESAEIFELRLKSQSDKRLMDAKKNFRRELYHITYMKRLRGDETDA